ncbi:MAG TPA: glycosyltransferase family 4 protein [Pyrinomonadaceae bacterium]|nr:glycosyltransferase family 4 protein [Pyrinomonadaceae bacterium]
MKILLAESMSYFSLGGASKATRGLIEGLTRKGHSCAVVSIENFDELAAQGFEVDGAKGWAELERDGVKIFAARNGQDQWRAMVECLQVFDPDWTLVSEHGVLLLTIALEEHDPARTVLVSQSIITHLPTESDARLTNHIRYLIGRAAGIITISEYMRDYIREWSGHDSTVLHFPSYGSGPFTHFNNFDRGYVTMINPCVYKGISIFLSLASRMPEVEFAAVLFWGTSPEDREALERLPNVTLLKPSPNLDDIFGQTKVLLVPSLWGEAYGQVVVDAMLRGVPVLASNVGGLPEAKLGVDYVLPVNMIERYETDTEIRVQPVVPEQDASPWVEALSRVLTDRAHYERLSLDSREAALSFVGSLGPHHFERYLEGLASARKSTGAGGSAPR